MSQLRNLSPTLETILPAQIRRDTLDLYLADNTVKRLSRGKVIRNIAGVPTEYDNWIREIDDFTYSIESSVDRITVRGQNVNSVLGFNLASNLRLLDYAYAEYGRVYQSSRNPALIEDIPQMFRCVLANAEASEQTISFELISDLDSFGQIIGSRADSPRCWWTYKNGIECTTTSSLPTCPKTRAACKIRGKEWEFGGTEFFEEPTPQPPPASGGGVIGGGGYDPPPCFSLDTNIWTPRGDIPFGELPVGKLEKPISHFSFDPATGEIYEDEILEVFEHETIGLFTFEFEHTTLNVTKEHPIFVALNKFIPADDFLRGQTARAFIEKWFDSKLKRIKWNSKKKATVRNLHSRRFPTYVANRTGVHNRKADDPLYLY